MQATTALDTRKRLPAPQEASQMYARSGWSDNKAGQRRAIISAAKLFLGSENVKSLTLPGSTFSFEQMLSEQFASFRMTTCEANAGVFERGIAYIPKSHRGDKLVVNQYRTNFGHILGASRNCGFHLHCDIEPVVCGDAMFPTWKCKKAARRVLKAFNFVWLDTVSPVGCKFLSRSVSNCHKTLSTANCFVCFSFIVGRDEREFTKSLGVFSDGDAIEKRVRFIEHQLSINRDVHSVDWFDHKGSGGIQMATAMFCINAINEGQEQ